ncbi:branched-chain amino acid aminotransferase [Moraxella osloensis]|nr:aminotransferase class IV [Moraxella osloensis]MBW4009896.1 branched-chain amino acid aminotransferase [Moraxella osloensis]
MWYSLSDAQYAKQTPITAIDIDSRVIAYGDGFFTTMAVVAGQINWLNYHLDRIDESAQALQLSLTNADLAFSSLDSFNLQSPNNTIRAYFNSQLANFAKTLNHGMLKLIVCRKNQPIKGYGFCNCQFDAFIRLMPTDKPLAQQANQVIIQPPATAICLTQQIACLPKPLVGLKLLNAQDKVMASHELWQHQTQNAQMIDGLVQDVMGHWVEGTFCNVFYQLNNKDMWYTPPINRSGVKGVMRQVLLAKFAQSDRAHEERYLTSEELANITSLFFCNAVRGILPIQALMLPNGQSTALDLAPIYTQKLT